MIKIILFKKANLILGIMLILLFSQCAFSSFGDEFGSLNYNNENPTNINVVGSTSCLLTEELPNYTADISQIINDYTNEIINTKEYILAVLEKRYPVAKNVVEKASSNYLCSPFLEAVVEFSAEDIITPPKDPYNPIDINVIVHECGHVFDNKFIGKGLTQNAYHINDDFTFIITGGTPEEPNPTFAESLLNDDEYSKLRPKCEDAFGDRNICDAYAYTYLNGSPDDNKHETGDQGLDNILEELNQYTNSLATNYSFQDILTTKSYSISNRDGVLTFLWYTQRYLKVLREDYPERYKNIFEDISWVTLISSLWNRAWLYLDATKDILVENTGNYTDDDTSAFGIFDNKIAPLLQDHDLLNEIDLIKTKAGCK